MILCGVHYQKIPLFSSVVSVGFDQEVYTCVGSKTCEVCISILSSTQLDNGLVASLSVTTIPMTAKGEFDVNYSFLAKIILL